MKEFKLADSNINFKAQSLMDGAWVNFELCEIDYGHPDEDVIYVSGEPVLYSTITIEVEEK